MPRINGCPESSAKRVAPQGDDLSHRSSDGSHWLAFLEAESNANNNTEIVIRDELAHLNTQHGDRAPIKA
jgi:hypothetical protein